MKQELRQERRQRDGSEICGTISSIREVEDCIRATRKYTKGVFRKSVHHPIQGEDFPSKVLTEFYEVYPHVDLSWSMPASTAWAWVWGDELHIDVFFLYDYRSGKASMAVRRGIKGLTIVLNQAKALNELKKMIPNLDQALEKAIASEERVGDA